MATSTSSSAAAASSFSSQPTSTSTSMLYAPMDDPAAIQQPRMGEGSTGPIASSSAPLSSYSSELAGDSHMTTSGFPANEYQGDLPEYFPGTTSSPARWNFVPMDDHAASQQHSASWMDEASMPPTALSSALPSSSSSSSELAGNSQMAMSAFAADGYPDSSPTWLPQMSSFSSSPPPPSGAPWNSALGVYAAADQGESSWMGESSTSQNASNGAFPSSSSDLANDAPPSTSMARQDNVGVVVSLAPPPPSLSDAVSSSWRNDLSSSPMSNTRFSSSALPAVSSVPVAFHSSPSPEPASFDQPTDTADFHPPSTSSGGGASPPPTTSSPSSLSSTSANHPEDPHAPDPPPRARNEEGLNGQTAQQHDRTDTADFHSPSTSPDGGASPPPTASSSSSSPPSLSNQPLSWVPNVRFSASIALRSVSSNPAAFTSWCPTEPASYIPDGATGSSSSSAPTATPTVRENVTTDSLLSWVMRHFSSAAFRYLDDERFLALHRDNPSDIQTLREAARRHGISRKDLEAFVGRACRGGIKLKALINE
ncbi:hypothetical protein BJ912DRAFT_995537 [Pholiota molesta]|nr:hypothetical protein BJ912DRAFT_995537 [Pholiota molesta]